MTRYQPHIFQHIQDFRGQVRALHVKFSQICFQEGRRRFFRLKGWWLPSDTQDSDQEMDRMLRCFGRHGLFMVCSFYICDFSHTCELSTILLFFFWFAFEILDLRWVVRTRSGPEWTQITTHYI